MKRNRSAYVIEDLTQKWGGKKYRSKLQMKKALLKLEKGRAYKVRLRQIKDDLGTYIDFWNVDMDYPTWTIGDIE